MQVSLNWLNEFVDLTDIDPKQIAHELTMSGLEVEEIEEIKPQFKNIITAKIVEIAQHPNADKLHLVTVDTGIEKKTVVCGAQNIEVGQIIPYASIGSEVFSRKTGEMFTLTPAEIRGVQSQGMLCSSDELGLSERGYQEEDGILILNRFLGEIGLGKPLEVVLNLEEDLILHTAPTANRGDQMSVVGIARELCAIFDKPLKFSPLESTSDLSTDKFAVEIIDEDVCKYYSIGVLKDLKIKKSPDWMQKRLVASGIRSISNVVDITNYVLLEYGIPLHAFDLTKLDGYLCIRRANVGEKFVTLDEVERELTNDSVLIATKKEGVCLAGVFGGANSGIDDNTTSIALEAAYFTPTSNRKSARSVGYRSDACARFERGVDIEAIKPALMRAMQLLVELADAKIEGVVEAGKNKLETIEITLRYAQIKRVLGVDISPAKCVSISENLGFKILGKNEVALKVEVPSFRANDVTREIDLIEEIARINGYDKISPTLPSKTMTPIITQEEKTLKKINSILLASGLNEIVTTSLIGAPLLKQFGLTYNDEKAVKVHNAQSEDHTMLRQTLCANVLNCLKYNYDNGQKNFWAYEIGRTYFIESPADEKSSGVEESRKLSGVISGEIENSKWQAGQKTDFYTLKGIFENLFAELKIDNRIVLQPCDDVSLLHPHRSAKVMMLGKNPISIGFFGQIHPILKDKMKINQEAFLFELNLEEILGAINTSVARFKKLPQFPEVQRDLAFVIPQEITFSDIQKIIKKSVTQNIFNGCEVFDIYQGENIEKGSKSVAFRIKMQDKSATLTDEVVEANMKTLRANLEKSFAGLSFRA